MVVKYLSGSAGTPDALTSPFLSREASSSSDGAERARLTEEKQNLEAAYHELAEETSALRSQLVGFKVTSLPANLYLPHLLCSSAG